MSEKSVPESEVSIPYEQVRKTFLHDALGTVKNHLQRREAEEKQKSLIAERDEYKGLSNIDALTGLPNGRQLLQDLKSRIQTINRQELDIEKGDRRSAPNLYVLFMDINNFKDFNSAFGPHEGGDQAIKLMAHLPVRPGDLLARKNDGGDEFIQVIEGDPHTLNEASLLELTNRHQKNIGDMSSELFAKASVLPTYTKDATRKISLTFGFAKYDGTQSAEDLIAQAGLALSVAKENRGSNIIAERNDQNAISYRTLSKAA